MKKGSLALSGIAQETEQKPTSNPDPAERRNSLFAYLGHYMPKINKVDWIGVRRRYCIYRFSIYVERENKGYIESYDTLCI